MTGVRLERNSWSGAAAALVAVALQKVTNARWIAAPPCCLLVPLLERSPVPRSAREEWAA